MLIHFRSPIPPHFIHERLFNLASGRAIIETLCAKEKSPFESNLKFKRKLLGGTYMIQVSGVGLRYGDRKLFDDVNIKFTR